MGNKGSILVNTIWILAIFMLVALGIGFRAVMELRLSKYALDSLKARYLAKAGIFMTQDLLLRRKTTEADSLYECGIKPGVGQTPAALFGPGVNALEGGAFEIFYLYGTDNTKTTKRYGVMDEERKINLRLDGALAGRLEEFRRVLKNLSPNLSDEVINAIIDWQDADSEPLPGGAEDTYYSNLEHPYLCKNTPFNYLEELRLVKGVTAPLFDSIKDSVTVYGDGMVNINTASGKVLNAVINENGKYDELVHKITVYRKGPDMEEGTADDRFFRNLGEDFFAKMDVTASERARITDLSGVMTCQSNCFRIQSGGTMAGVTRTVTAIVKRKGAEDAIFQTQYYHEA